MNIFSKDKHKNLLAVAEERARFQKQAFLWLAEDFLQKCPEMSKVGVDAGALYSRYLGYVMNGTRPYLPGRDNEKD